tara:strand:- start:892 stop:1128 length:237 start_codon:yes stop_codon:yes gene_type:complete
MLTGFIRTFGKKAIAIEDSNKNQYYAVMKDIDQYIIEHLHYPLHYLPVKFTVNKSKIAGITKIGPRYHAKNVKLDLEF